MTQRTIGLAAATSAAVLSAALVPGAAAGPLTLRWSDNLGNTVTVADEAAGDLLPGVGTMAYVGTPTGGSGPSVFDFNVVVGSSEPFLPAPYPNLQLFTESFANGAAGTLTIELSQTGFTGPASVLGFASLFDGSFSADAGGTFSIEAFVNLDDGLFSTAGTRIGGASGGPGGFNVQDWAFAPVDASYSVTLRVVVNVTGTMTFVGNAAVQVPEPAALALFGLGLLGLGILRRRAAV